MPHTQLSRRSLLGWGSLAAIGASVTGAGAAQADAQFPNPGKETPLAAIRSYGDMITQLERLASGSRYPVTVRTLSQVGTAEALSEQGRELYVATVGTGPTPAGQPYFCSEYGGIWWVPESARSGADSVNDSGESWGYGDRVRDEEEFYARAEGLTRVLDQDPLMFGYCYTQLTDVFQEKNGIYGSDRSEKFDPARIRAIFGAEAAYERGD
ncbi:glycoside hydrolase family 2 [Serinicoccus profundi]|uniref:glycoside hydrolase family 2 n=1 Tax=Serinicoccus profundi TaxID=1078471 RepID=UPI000255E561